jgi:hypothetical protein
MCRLNVSFIILNCISWFHEKGCETDSQPGNKILKSSPPLLSFQIFLAPLSNISSLNCEAHIGFDLCSKGVFMLPILCFYRSQNLLSNLPPFFSFQLLLLVFSHFIYTGILCFLYAVMPLQASPAVTHYTYVQIALNWNFDKKTCHIYGVISCFSRPF